jgi:1-acyl-sn-glycerol-3-phosphate acyltransferase
MTDTPAASPGQPITRDLLIGVITGFLANTPGRALLSIRSALEEEIDRAGADGLAAMNHRLSAAGADWSYYPADPLARRVHHVLADNLLHQDSAVGGLEWTESLAGRPVVIFANHLSYSDANLLEILLHRFGGAALADRLTVTAGPKVYSSLKRRFSSLCFGTVKTPQSSTRSSEDAVMNPREVALAARRSIDICHERLRGGDLLLVFPEGTRSRESGMQQTLAGATRYLDAEGLTVLPVGIWGTEALFPIGDESIYSVPIVAQIGRPIDATLLHDRAAGNRRLVMDAIGLAIGRLLPPAYQGVYADETPGLDDARRLLDACG